MSSNLRFAHGQLLYGGDYNPEQWPPDVWREDVRLMKVAGWNVVTIGVFSWARLEPRDGEYDFAWLDEIISLLTKNGIQFILSTPTCGFPIWLAHRHPEVLRVSALRHRYLPGERGCFCPSSPIFRRKAQEINTQLARRYGGNQSLVLWHVGNEYGTECHCELCQGAFQKWLQSRYGSLDQLNTAWYTQQWGRVYSSWDEIQSPTTWSDFRGQTSLHGLNLDWRRFTTDQVIDFFEHECAPVRRYSEHVPTTTNFMGMYFTDYD